MESAGDYFFLAGKTLNGTVPGVKKVEAPSKNPENCPIMSFAQEKKIISPTFQISGALVILCPKERARERERKREREQEPEREQERTVNPVRQIRVYKLQPAKRARVNAYVQFRNLYMKFANPRIC